VREPALDEGLAIGAREEAARDAPAVGDVERGLVERDLHRQDGHGLAGDGRRGGAILGDRGGDVVRALEPAFDLERRDAEVGEAGDGVEPDEILGRQEVGEVAEIALVAIDDQVVRQPAGLRTLAAVRRAPPARPPTTSTARSTTRTGRRG